MMEKLKEIEYVIADPTKNITILVKTPVPAAKRAELSQLLMFINPSCEQVGFLNNVEENADEAPAGLSEAAGCNAGKNFDIRLDMMGGEFCGNATMATASYFAFTKDLEVGESMRVNVSSSGVENTLPVDIVCGKDNWGKTYTCTIEMPGAEKIGEIDGCPVVYLPGIAHMIVPAGAASIEECEMVIREYQKIAGTPAFGMLIWDEEKSFMTPLVYVSDTDSCVRENGCATGSTAIGIWRASTKNATETDVHQPGGTINIKLSTVGTIGSIVPTLTSVVLLVSTKETLRTSII